MKDIPTSLIVAAIKCGYEHSKYVALENYYKNCAYMYSHFSCSNIQRIGIVDFASIILDCNYQKNISFNTLIDNIVVSELQKAAFLNYVYSIRRVISLSDQVYNAGVVCGNIVRSCDVYSFNAWADQDPLGLYALRHSYGIETCLEWPSFLKEEPLDFLTKNNYDNEHYKKIFMSALEAAIAKLSLVGSSENINASELESAINSFCLEIT